MLAFGTNIWQFHTRIYVFRIIFWIVYINWDDWLRDKLISKNKLTKSTGKIIIIRMNVFFSSFILFLLSSFLHQIITWYFFVFKNYVWNVTVIIIYLHIVIIQKAQNKIMRVAVCCYDRRFSVSLLSGCNRNFRLGWFKTLMRRVIFKRYRTKSALIVCSCRVLFDLQIGFCINWDLKL